MFDLFGWEQPKSDRIRNVVILGVNCFGWAHKVHELVPSAHIPELRLIAPSGSVWAFGDDDPAKLNQAA